MYDLNVPWPVQTYAAAPTQTQLTNLHNTIAMLHSLGYTHLALNFIVDENVKLPFSTPSKLNPIAMGELRAKFKAYRDLHLFSRITLVVSDPAKCQSVLKLHASSAFDLVAVQPTTEKALQLATTNLDIDLVSLPMSVRLPFFLKHKTVGLALTKGIHFEICYAGLIAGPAGYESSTALGTSGHISRKTFFSNCLQLVRASRCRGLVFSSGACEPLHVRNYSEILAIMAQLGLKVSNAKVGFTQLPEATLVNGRLRKKSNKQTVMIGNDVGSVSRGSAIVEHEDATGSTAELFKRKKTDGGPEAKRAKT